MKRIKILIIVLVMVIIIIIGAIVWLRNDNKEYPERYFNDIDMGVNETPEILEEEVSELEYYKVQSCISIYFQIINKNNSAYYGIDENGNNVKTTQSQEINNMIYNILSETYIKEHNITIDNIESYVDMVDENLMFNILDIRKVQKNSINQFVVYGFTNNLEYNFIKYSMYIVNIDEDKNIFSIEPIIKEYNNIDEVVVKECNIEKNDDNEIPAITVNTEKICKEYLTSYKRIALSKPEVAYQYLDEEYRENRFGSVEKYKSYIEENKEEISKIRLSKYTGDIYNDYEEYICIDQNENMYIFKVYNLVNYKIILDTYTLDLPEFIESYNSTNNQGKTALNIQKFFQAINAKDYAYAYSKLADSFKNNYFKTEKDFEDYMKNNFFSYNKVEYGEFSVEGDVNVYKLTITDQTGNSNNKLSLNIIMQLQEGTNFVMSFGT